MKRRAAIYCRISQDREGAGLGVQRQRQDCEDQARRLGWPVVTVHEDNDLSAYAGKPRPGYRALLEDLEQARADAVVVWHTDRLHRHPRELEDFIDLCERRGVVVQAVKSGELDLSTPTGQMTARIVGAVSRHESAHKAERVRRAQQQKAARGEWGGGARPYGWKPRPDGTAVLDRAEAKQVRDATRAVIAGRPLGSIVAEWNAAGVLTARGNPWSATTVRQLLLRARNAGQVEYAGQVLGRSKWPAIVAEDEWRAVRAVLTDASRRRSRSNRARWLMAGMLKCGAPNCGEPMRTAVVVGSRVTRDNRTVYRCTSTGTGHASPGAEFVDDLVAAAVVARLSRDDARDLLRPADEESSDLQADALAMRAELEELAAACGRGELSTAQLTIASKGLHERLIAVESAQRSTAQAVALAPLVNAKDARRAWDRLDLARRRIIVRVLMDVVVCPVGRGRRYEPEDVRIQWGTAG